MTDPAKRFTLEEFLAFAKSKDPDEVYDPHDSTCCALRQFVDHIGLEVPNAVVGYSIVVFGDRELSLEEDKGRVGDVMDAVVGAGNNWPAKCRWGDLAAALGAIAVDRVPESV